MVLFVGLGGAIGAMGRYLLGLVPLRQELPRALAFLQGRPQLVTLLVNLLGAVLIGFVVGAAALRPGLSPNWTAFLKTGVCGGFTTFSTFSLETLNLLESGSYSIGILYAGASVAFCILGVLLGRTLAALLLRQGVQ